MPDTETLQQILDVRELLMKSTGIQIRTLELVGEVIATLKQANTEMQEMREEIKQLQNVNAPLKNPLTE